MTDQRRTNLLQVRQKLDEILAKMKAMEVSYFKELSEVHPIYTRSAKNLIHYLALRDF